jgi:hypothetical protein
MRRMRRRTLLLTPGPETHTKRRRIPVVALERVAVERRVGWRRVRRDDHSVGVEPGVGAGAAAEHHHRRSVGRVAVEQDPREAHRRSAENEEPPHSCPRPSDARDPQASSSVAGGVLRADDVTDATTLHCPRCVGASHRVHPLRRAALRRSAESGGWRGSWAAAARCRSVYARGMWWWWWWWWWWHQCEGEWLSTWESLVTN